MIDREGAAVDAPKLLVDERGTSAIEFAFVIPILVLLIAGMSDVALKGSMAYLHTNASNRAVELALSKGAVDGKFDYIIREAAHSAGVSTESVQVDYWLECEYVRQASFDASCNAPNLPFRYVKVTISSDYEALFPDWILPAQSTVSGSAVLRVQ